ncbi:AbrB family transcriptional regulator [Roseospira navarrensis]|nr:AbrB family transcriptional regulator [Roseospira navarrensis]
MDKAAAARVLLTLTVAAGGAGAAVWAGMPAPALLGSTVAVTLAALARLPVRMPVALRNGAFAVIGCSLGTGVTPDFLSDAARWPVSLAVLCAVIVLTMVLSGRILERGFGQSRDTAILATSPGALSYALAISSAGVGDARAVMVLQSLRLLAMTLVLPSILGLLGGAGGAVWGSHHPTVMAYPVAILMLAAALAGGWGLDRLKAPAAFLLAGIAISGGLHGLGVVAGQFPPAFLMAGFTVTGAVIGTRFRALELRELARLALAALLTISLALTISASLALLVAWGLAMPFGQVWVAYAPGGVEAMAAMALSLGYDPTYVATHHVFRIVSLILVLPVVLRVFGSGRGRAEDA